MRSVRSAHETKPCSTMSFKAVQGVLVTGRGCGTSLVVKAQRKVKSQLLPSNRFAASMDDTISKVWLRMKACAAHERTRSRTAALTTAEQLGLHVLRAPETQERQQGRAILSQVAQRTEGAQLGGALAADHMLGFKKFR